MKTDKATVSIIKEDILETPEKYTDRDLQTVRRMIVKSLDLIGGLKSMDDASFDYTAFETDDPTKFIALLEFDGDAAKQRFLDSAPFAQYRDGAKERFTGPPSTTSLKLVDTTRR